VPVIALHDSGEAILIVSVISQLQITHIRTVTQMSDLLLQGNNLAAVSEKLKTEAVNKRVKVKTCSVLIL
jgi:hypothetical protein